MDFRGSIGESMDFGSTRGLDIILSLLIDDGNNLRTQRANLFYPDFKYVGIGVHGHTGYHTCVVIDYVEDIVEKP